jgi:hypothetical protein
MIELWDARTVIRTHEYKDEDVFGSTEALATIHGFDLVKLGRIFGLDIRAGDVISSWKVGDEIHKNLSGDAQISIYPDDAEKWQCTELHAEPREGNRLDFRIGWSDKDDGPVVYEDYTYNGKYVIHWANVGN